jgi:assimilatory nitrate reductase catalytic subunit
VQRDAGKAMVDGFLLAGDTSAQAWISTLLQSELDATSYGRLLLSPGSQAPVAIQSKGAQVCTCFNVTQPEIEAQLKSCTGSDDERFAQLQSALKCGTNCGSCVPQLKKIIRQTAPTLVLNA